ncbi:hypothetical protein IH574_01520 [Candidatus Bathyarchaeota archaeon]|nr:hypothetical protein [Candidatus Bathyarchaeota archaeon]
MIDIASAERCRKILERADAVEAMDRRKNEALKDPECFEEKLRAAIMRI